MRRVAMFGGSFNPVHLGHIKVACEVIERFCLDRLYIIPTAVTPLKDNSHMATADDRLEMCRLAFKDIDKVNVLDIEIKRQGESFTVDTVEELLKADSDMCFHIVVGGDSFEQLPLWHRAEDIFSLAKIIAVARDEVDAMRLSSLAQTYKEKYSATVLIIENSLSLISSTKVRASVSDGGDFSSLVSSDVADYIVKNKLYGYDDYEA
ncbi:MAG: nicotinate-nucleotide adenylyltransferase [Ruminococcus sp.]